MAFKKMALIPARYASTRFPGKLMEKLGGQTVIATVYHNTRNTGLFDAVMVVTDSEIIFNEIKSIGGEVVMSTGQHESGTDRIAEVVAGMDVEIIVNVQGDSPFVKGESLADVIKQFDDESVQVASLMRVLTDEKEINNPNCVKVCVDKKGNALYFSRSPIPYPRNKAAARYYQHVGLYAFRKSALMQFTSWPVSELEDTEKLEQLRYLENGISIRMVLTEYAGVEIDTPEDLIKATALL